MRWIAPLFVATLVASLTMLMACGSVQPSEELQQLEQELQAPETQRLREIPNAARYHDEARQYRRVSREAREDRRGERSQEYAILGLLRLQTAEAIYEQFQTIDELNEVNALIEEVNPQIREVTQSRNELAEELRDLDSQIQQAVREREEARRAEMASESGFEAAQRGDGASDTEILQQANEKIARAQELRQIALEHNADEYDRTRGLFGRADSQLERARDMIEDNPRSAQSAKRQLGFAVQLFEEATEIAIPLHEEMVEKMQPANRIAAIQDVAAAIYSGRFTEDKSDGVRIIMARLFVRGEEDFQRETGAMLNALADIVNEYEEFSVRIEGYTQAGGGTTQNRTLSQVRAQRVRNELVDAGIDEGRIETSGYGQSDLRFPDSPDNNDRVEVILRHTDR